MFISAMNVVIVISFLIGGILYYMSSSSTGASAAAKGDATFRGFSNGIFLHKKHHFLWELFRWNKGKKFPASLSGKHCHTLLQGTQQWAARLKQVFVYKTQLFNIKYIKCLRNIIDYPWIHIGGRDKIIFNSVLMMNVLA